ncbi:MAG TPA: rhamnogalacturonan acetylesterase [Bacteroidales bacterium]|nr:rhamnogalacturonan acetylesterase [Bacteroidales bacterium]
MLPYKTYILLFILVSLHANLTSQGISAYKFSFGPAKEVPGYIKINVKDKYSAQTGYGFDFGTIPFAIDRGGKKPLTSGFCTGDKPFFFSVRLPAGNYNIKIITGDLKESSLTTVRTESRRLIFEKISTEPGKFKNLTATVNIRTPKIGDTGEEVIRKPGEMNKLNWDEKLTFEFTGKRPCICALEITRTIDAVTVFLAGNSTVVDQDDDPWASWGQMFPRFLAQGAAVSNQAESGLSPGSFLSSNRFKQVMNMMKPGDYLFIEFGHNDQKENGPDDGAFKSYSESIRLFVNDFREKGGIPVIVSPANRRSFGEDGKLTNSPGDYPEAAKKVAEELKVAFIDLNAMTKTLYEAMGPENSKKLFVIYPAGSFPGQKEALDDNTHFNTYGAYQLAKCIIEGVKNNKLELRNFLIKGLPSYNPSKPDPFESFGLPLSPQSPVIITN